MTTQPKSVTLKRAEIVATLLLARGAQTVDLFGSTARKGDGKDIDLIVGVDEKTAWKFLARIDGAIYGVQKVRKFPTAFHKGDIRSLRFTLVLQLLKDLDLRELFEAQGGHAETMDMTKEFRPVDLILFPPQWERRLGDIKPRLRRTSDPRFIYSLCKDARRFDPQTQSFDKHVCRVNPRTQTFLLG